MYFLQSLIAFWIPIGLLPALEKETFPPLKTGQAAPQSFTEMWAGFDPRAEPLDVEVLQEWEEDGVVVRILRYRAGIFKGKKAMIAAIYGFPKEGAKLPGLVQIHGGGQYADANAVVTNAKRGYATLSVSWAGRISSSKYRVGPAEVKLFWEGKRDEANYRVTTDWGALDGYHAPCRNPKNNFSAISPAAWTLDAVESPRNNPWFLCNLAARRALTFLERQAEVDADKLGVYGHSMGGKLTVMTAASDKRVKAAAPSCGGISDRESNFDLYRKTIADGVQLPHITCPIIFLSPANDFHGRISNLETAIEEGSSKDWRVTCSPHHNHQDTSAYEVATQLWFDAHLKGNFEMPATPKTELTLAGVPEIRVTPDVSRKILSVDFFYTQQGKMKESRHDMANTRHRCWHHRSGKLVNGTATVTLPLLDLDRPLWVYANIRYALDAPITGAGYYYGLYTAKDFNLSSLLHQVSPGELKEAGATATDRPSLVIEDFQGDWRKGWFNYREATGDWSITSNKLYDPKWKAPKQAGLSMEILSTQAQKMVVKIDDHFSELNLEGGVAWQTITLKPDDFLDVEGKGNLKWATAQQIKLSPQEALRKKGSKTRVLGGSWKGAAPRFRNLRWTTRPGMPKPEDQTQIWWEEGFPTHKKGAPWRRVIETGCYRLVVNTETLEVSELGREGKGAELELQIKAGGKIYTAQGGAEWTRQTGPRLIESGRFFQRMDVTDLLFKSEDGEELKAEASIEIAAWADRLAFILVAKKGLELSIRLKSDRGQLQQKSDQGQVALALDPVTFREVSKSPVMVKTDFPVRYEHSLGWHRMDLEKSAARGEGNNMIERVHFRLTNPSQKEEVARLVFAKQNGGFRGRFGVPITGVSAILRDAEGNPTGIPVQLSKNWHRKKEAGTYQGQWFHGITQVRLPAEAVVDLEITIVHGHWGGVAAASHAQLSLIGWGGNSLWEQSALGDWGESICYDPDQALANTTITDVRPLMVTPMNGRGKWGWTENVGGGDFFRFFTPKGDRVAHSAMRASYHKYGPCLTEVTYGGKIGDGIKHSATVSLGRTDDLIRGIYRIRLDVEKAVDFSRFVIFQVGSDTYNSTIERKLAIGDAGGLTKEWDARWGGNAYRGEAVAMTGIFPWASLHEGVARESEKGGAIANRGFVIREWKARLGGEEVAPFIAERGLTRHRQESSTLDLLPPPHLTRFEKGDFIEATIEHVVVPQFAKDYYGPNEALREALKKNGNTWRMIHREAKEDSRTVHMKRGKLVHRFPDVRIETVDDAAEFQITGGLGYVPITFTGLTSADGHVLKIGGKEVDQSVHGKDYWQIDFDPSSKTWSQTFNIPVSDQATREITFVIKK